MDAQLLMLLLMMARAVFLTAAYQTRYLEGGGCVNGSDTFDLVAWGEGSAFLLRATPHTSYSMQLECRVRVVAPPGHQVTLSVREIDFKTSWDGACVDYVKIRNLNYCKRLYREEEERHFDSTDGELDFFYSTKSADNATLSGFAGFGFTLTAFRTGGEETNGSFECSNGHLVWSGLACDGHNNCGDMSDEEIYGPSDCGGGGRGPSVLIVLGLIIVFLMLVMCVSTLLCSKNERVRRFSTRIRTRTLSFMRRGKRNSSS